MFRQNALLPLHDRQGLLYRWGTGRRGDCTATDDVQLVPLSPHDAWVPACKYRFPQSKANPKDLQTVFSINKHKEQIMPLPVHTNAEKPSNSGSLPANAAESTSNATIHEAAASAGVGSKQVNGGSSAEGKMRSEVEKAADKLYEERIEDEYAKREGGA